MKIFFYHFSHIQFHLHQFFNFVVCKKRFRKEKKFANLENLHFHFVIHCICRLFKWLVYLSIYLILISSVCKASYLSAWQLFQISSWKNLDAVLKSWFKISTVWNWAVTRTRGCEGREWKRMGKSYTTHGCGRVRVIWLARNAKHKIE